jgi:hypothetical protein
MVQADKEQQGFSHVLVLLIFVVGFALVGTYMLVKSHASTAMYGCSQQGTVRFAYSSSRTATVYHKPYYQTLSESRKNNSTCVQSLQRKVALWCTYDTAVSASGVYGGATAKAVLRIQQAAQRWGWRADGRVIGTDGIAGPQTWAILQAYNSSFQKIKCN